MKFDPRVTLENLILSRERHVVKQGLDWISKTWTGLVKYGLVKHGLVKHGLVKTWTSKTWTSKTWISKTWISKTWTDTVLFPRLVFVHEKTCIAQKSDVVIDNILYW